MKKNEYMKRAIRLARKGTGSVHPNPLVGAVIVKNDTIIGEGYHAMFGGPHAEIIALSQISPDDAKYSSLYVTLEPCAHQGKTPPCTDAIIRAGIKKVVIGIEDPNPLVAGKGILLLKSAGIEVECGIMKTECKNLNEAFFKYIQQKQPYITLKIAQTLDGKIAAANGLSRWITNESSRKKVHRLRAEHDAVLVGVNTVIQDDPDLSVRHIRGKHGIRIILDSALRVPLESRVLKNQNIQKTVIATTNRAESEKTNLIKKKGAEIWILRENAGGGILLSDLWNRMIEEGIISVLIEGGREVFTSVLKSGVADRLVVFTAPKLFGTGIGSIGDLGIQKPSDALQFESVQWRSSGSDMMFDGRLACLPD